MSVTYIVPWQEVVGKEFLEEFIRIARAFLRAGLTDIEACAVVRKKLEREAPEALERYDKCRHLLRACGFELQHPNDLHRWRGWIVPYLERDELKFRTTAPADRVHISWADLQTYRSLCELADKDRGRDHKEMFEANAARMERKYGLPGQQHQPQHPDPIDPDFPPEQEAML